MTHPCRNREKTYAPRANTAARTLLFALWHVGYAVGLYLWNGGSLLHILLMKVLTGAVFGVITGAIRYKTKNCYGGILVHGVLNAIG